jgi:hypothetical protein
MTIGIKDVLTAKAKYGWPVILFADQSKSPEICGKWGDFKDQTEVELIALYEKVKGRAWNWGPICGFEGVVGFDFDWAFIFGLWHRRFSDRAKTLTFQTPNGGARVFFRTDETVSSSALFKKSLHFEFLAVGRYAAVGGEAVTEDGTRRPYELVLDAPIRRDNTIVKDTVDFFISLLEGRYSWLLYKCINRHMDRKHVILSHEQGLAINAFMLLKGCDDWEVHNFRRGLYAIKDGHHVSEYNERVTEAQIRSGRDYIAKGGLPFPCRATDKNAGLAAVFNFDESLCGGCLRRSAPPQPQTTRGVKLGDYRLLAKGGKAFLLDTSGKPAWSCNLSSLDGPRATKRLVEITKVDEEEVASVVAALLYSLERQEEKPDSEEKGQEEIDPKVDEEAEALLKDPRLLYRINKALNPRICGEDENRIFMVMAGCGAKQKTSMIRLEGPNAVGKKMLYYWLPEIFGEDDVAIITTSTFPYWKRKILEGWSAKEKIIVCVEERGDYGGIIKFTFEQVYSEDKIVFGMNVKDEEGEWEPVEVVLEGPLLFVTSSTDPESNLHSATREWSVKPDASLTQTRAIDQWWRARELVPKSKIEEEDREIKVVRRALSKLNPDPIKIPFIDKINFPLDYLMDRRKARDFDNLIRYSAFIHERQRPKVHGTIYALPHDFYYAKKVADKILAITRGDLSPDEKELLAFIKAHPELDKWTKDGKPPDDKHQAECFKVSNIVERREYTRLHEKTVRNMLNSLAQKRRLGKNVVSRSNVVYYDLPAEGESSTHSPSLSPVSPKELSLAITRVEESSPEDGEKIFSEVARLMAQPIIDPITGETQTLDESPPPWILPPQVNPSETESSSFGEKKASEVERVLDSTGTSPVSTRLADGVSPPSAQFVQEIPVRDKLKIILEKARELAKDGVFSKFSVADALQGQMDRLEVFQLLSKLHDKGEFAMKDLESYVLAKPTPLSMRVQGRRCGQCKLHRTQYCPMAHQETIPEEGAYAETCQLFGPKENVDETTGRGNEWDGFVAIGPMATPEKNYRQTIQALRKFVELEHRQTISKDELESPLKLYWAESSWPLVTQRLLDDGILTCLGDVFKIDAIMQGPPKEEGGKPRPLCDRCFSQHRGAKIVSRPLPDYVCIECGDKATVMAEVLEE